MAKTIQDAINSINGGSISGDGTYNPPANDTDWRDKFKNYPTSPLTPPENSSTTPPPDDGNPSGGTSGTPTGGSSHHAPTSGSSGNTTQQSSTAPTPAPAAAGIGVLAAGAGAALAAGIAAQAAQGSIEVLPNQDVKLWVYPKDSTDDPGSSPYRGVINEEATPPIKLTFSPPPDPFTGGLGRPTAGTNPVQPDPLPYPQLAQPLNDGYGTQEVTATDLVDWSKLQTTAEQAQLANPDTGASLAHYLDNTGTDLPIDVNSLLGANPDFLAAVTQQRQALAATAIAQAQASGATGPVTFPVNTQWTGATSDPTSAFSIGSFNYSQQGYVTVYPPADAGSTWQADMSTQVSIYSTFPASVQQPVTYVPGVDYASTPDLKQWMSMGLAKEFTITGSSATIGGQY